MDAMAARRKRLMLDVSYAGSALVGHAGAVATGPSPGERFPACHRLRGVGHHLIVFGEASRLDHVPPTWGGRSIVDASGGGFDAAEAGLPDGGASWCVRTASSVSARARDEATMARARCSSRDLFVPDVRTTTSGHEPRS